MWESECLWVFVHVHVHVHVTHTRDLLGEFKDNGCTERFLFSIFSTHTRSWTRERTTGGTEQFYFPLYFFHTHETCWTRERTTGALSDLFSNTCVAHILKSQCPSTWQHERTHYSLSQREQTLVSLSKVCALVQCPKRPSTVSKET